MLSLNPIKRETKTSEGTVVVNLTSWSGFNNKLMSYWLPEAFEVLMRYMDKTIIVIG